MFDNSHVLPHTQVLMKSVGLQRQGRSSIHSIFPFLCGKNGFVVRFSLLRFVPCPGMGTKWSGWIPAIAVAALAASNFYRSERTSKSNLLPKLGLSSESNDQRPGQALEQKCSSLLSTLLTSFLPGFLMEPESYRKGHTLIPAKYLAAFP